MSNCNNHTCSLDRNNKLTTYKWLEKRYLEQFGADRNWFIQGLINRVQNDFHIEIKRLKAYRVKQMTLQMIDKDE